MSEKILSKQNEVIISLLARHKDIFGEEKIRKIVTANKRNAAAWIKGYNACNGKNGVVQIATIAGVKQPTATVILQSWEKEGIIYNDGDKNRPLYVKLLNLKEEKDAGSEQGNTGRIEETQPEFSETNIPE